MSLDPALVEATIRSGLSAVCATCTKYWQGRERGLPEPKCTAVAPCGSPLANDDFSSYEGPIQLFSKFCFVCAGPSKAGLTVRGRKRIIGVCAEHLKMFRNLKPTVAAPEAAVSAITDAGRVLRPEDLTPKLKPSLFQALNEAESTFEK